MSYTRKRLWKRSRKTTTLIHEIRRVIKEAGYEEEMATTPLLNTISVLVRRGEDIFNVRLNKETLAIVETDQLKYSRKRDSIRRVFRRAV